MKKVVHVVGTGTIGEPLIGLFTDFSDRMGIDEVTFHKRTPLAGDRSRLKHLMDRGALLAVDEGRAGDFEALGHPVSFEAKEAIARATVVIDCTPAGNQNKEKLYTRIPGPNGFLAQGSEFGFGKPYARGVNDEVLDPEKDRFLQIVSCNTHNITTLIKTLCDEGNGEYSLARGEFVCMRRANDITQAEGFVPAPQVGKHDDPRFGTHHARDAWHLFSTLGYDLNLYSSAIKLNTQYMHCLWFNMRLKEKITLPTVVQRLKANRRMATTEKTSANQIYSFGRDHGHYGRILSQTVVPLKSLSVVGDHEVVGFAFTPQDGNPLLSSVAITSWFFEPDGLGDRLDCLRPYLFHEI